MSSLLSILLGTRGGGHCLKVHLFSELGAEALTRPSTGPGWVRKGLRVAGNPTPGPARPPPQSSSWAEAESGSPARPAAAPSPPRALRREDVQRGHRMGSHPKAQLEMKDKWLLHLSQIAFFGLSLAIWHGFLGWGGLRGNCMLPAQSCAGWRRWRVGGPREVWIAFRPPGPQFAAEQALAQASKSRLNVPCGI